MFTVCCPKCGCLDTDTSYCPAYYPHEAFLAHKESVLHRRCSRCRYPWDDRCRYPWDDQPNDAKKAD